MRPSDDAIAPDPLGPEPVGSPPAAGGHGSRRERLLTRWQGATLALLAGGLLFGACQGDNIWSGNSESLQPQVVGIAAPATVYPGDTLQVQVSAYGARQITSVSVQLSGAATLDTTVSLQPAATVAANLRIPLSTYLADTMLVIRAVAYDKTGAISRMRSDTTRAIAPPAVVSMSGPDSVRPGSSLSFEVRATGVRPITRIRFALRGAVTRYDSIMVAQPRKDVTDAITFQVAATDLTDTTLVVSAQPVDNSGLDGFITRGTIPVAIPAPVITLLTAPDSVRAGGSLDVSVDARALRNVTRLAFSLRGAVTRDSAVNVAVPAHTVTQSASFIIPPEAQDSLIKLSVSAIDAAGKASIPTVKNISIPTGIPVVDSLVVGDSIRPGTILDARVFAHGSRQLSRIDLSLRGAVNRDINMVPSPPRTNVTADFAVPMPDTMADTLMVVMAKATDAGGSVSAIKQKVIRASDTALPTVTATLSQNSIAAGRNLLVHLIAKDNVGLGSIGLRLLNSANTVLSTVSAAASGRSRDTTLSLPIPIMGPATLSVIAFAVDRGGREGRSTPMPLTVVDSVAPIADIVAPTAGATYPLSDSVRVQVHVGSIVGVKKVRVQGIAIRENCCGPTQIVDRYREYTLSFPQPPAMRLPLDTLLQNCWLKYLPGETTAEMVYLVATVTDSANNVATDTVQVSVGGPFVQILSPTNGGNVGVGQPFQLRLMAKDGTGLDSIRIRLGGAASRSTLLTYPRTIPPTDSVLYVASDSVPTAGVVTIDAEAWNYNQIIGRAATVSVTAVQGGTSDIQPPSVRIASITSRGATLTDLTRIELTDSVNVEVDAYDNGGAGLRRMGLTVIAVPSSTIPGLRPDTLQVTFVPAQGGQATNIFRVLPRDFGLDERIARLGGAYNVQLQFTAFALDTLSQCGATAQIGAFESIACVPASGSFYTATGRTGVTRTIALVGGKTVSLPNGGKIADVAVDQNREKLYLSNITQNKVEILRMSDTTFAATGGSNSIGLVGSQPWGLFLNYHGGVYDTLMVANSGSTTISFLVVDDTRPDYLREHLARRLLTPNEVLWEVKTTLTQTALRYKGSFYDFSDRPQFVAQDVAGRTLFSTVPTGSAPDGTLRMADPAHSAPVLEPGLLFNSAAVVPTEDIMAIASLDSLKVVAGGAVDDSILMYDHVPGQPNNVIRTPNPMTLAGAVAYMQTHGSDMRTFAGKWDVTKVGMSDTTFMAVSGDRTAVAFGEGATSPTGRIMLWDGVAGGVSNEVSVVDLVHNASERVFGLGLDADGQFGVARGALGAYFFTGRPPASGTPQPLRLQGLFNTPGSAGGAALHPTHSGGPTSAVNALAFISTPNHSVKILDSAHFYERGEIQLRDNVVGPVKAALPFSGDNAGLLPADPSYVLVKLFCVTADAAGKTQVVVVNVRNKDLTN